MVAMGTLGGLASSSRLVPESGEERRSKGDMGQGVFVRAREQVIRHLRGVRRSGRGGVLRSR